MKADFDILVTLAVQFAIMSLLALGGANAVVPEMHRQAVELRGWMTERQFADMFAISQAAPGPNVMLVTLIGYHVAGVGGCAGHHLGDVRSDRSAGRIFSAAPGTASRMRPGGWPCRRGWCRFRSASLAPAPSS